MDRLSGCPKLPLEGSQSQPWGAVITPKLRQSAPTASGVTAPERMCGDRTPPECSRDAWSEGLFSLEKAPQNLGADGKKGGQHTRLSYKRLVMEKRRKSDTNALHKSNSRVLLHQELCTTREDEPSNGSGTSTGVPCPAAASHPDSLCHPRQLQQLWLARRQWQRGTGQGDKLAPHEPGSPSEKGSPTAPGTGSGLHHSARSPALGSSKLSEL